MIGGGDQHLLGQLWKTRARKSPVGLDDHSERCGSLFSKALSSWPVEGPFIKAFRKTNYPMPKVNSFSYALWRMVIC